MSLEDKIKNIKSDIAVQVKNACAERFWIDCYGAYDIDPKHLVFWVCVRSDRVKRELASNINLVNTLRNLLNVHDYPVEARNSVYIGFESEETVCRESGGNWYYHLK